MEMPKPVGYLSQYNLTMLEQGYPQTIVMLKGAKRDLPLYDKQALIDLLEQAAVECESQLETGAHIRCAAAVRKLKEKL